MKSRSFTQERRWNNMSKKELEIKSEQLHEAVQKAIADNNFKLVSELLLKEAEVNNQLAELEFEKLRNKQIETDNKISEVLDEINNNGGEALPLVADVANKEEIKTMRYKSKQNRKGKVNKANKEPKRVYKIQRAIYKLTPIE